MSAPTQPTQPQGFNLWSMLDLVLIWLEAIVAATPGTFDDLLVAAAKSALAELRKVRGQPVTKEQLEALRFVPQWPTVT